MIKDLKKFQIKMTPFQATKNWELDNVYNEGVILLEQTASDGSDIALALEFYEYGDGSDLPITGSDCDMALEQQDADRIHYKEGLNIVGTFYPTTEPVNSDGTYKRSVYHQYKTSFYNEYRNPTQMWGIENIDFELSKTKRYLSDEIRILEAPPNVYGDKISPNTVRMVDRSLNDDYTISDDGYGNLFAGTNLFSTLQEVGDFGNVIVDGRSNLCDTYFNPLTPVSIVLSVSSGSAIATWIPVGTRENYFSVQRSVDGVNFSEITTTPTGVQTYTDTTVTSSYTGATYWYRVESINTEATSSTSNTASITFTLPPLPPEPTSTCKNPVFPAQFFTESLKTWLTYDLV